MPSAVFGPGVVEINKTIFLSLRNSQVGNSGEKRYQSLHHVIIIKGYLGSTVRRKK